jgi:hypothetical protein
MAHPPFWPFSPKSNGFSVSPVSKGEQTAKIRPFSLQQLRRQSTPLSESGRLVCELAEAKPYAISPLGGHWSKIRAEG